MNLTGKLKENVEKAKTREEAKKLIARAGMLLDDDELNQVSGGVNTVPRIDKTKCPQCGGSWENVFAVRTSGMITTYKCHNMVKDTTGEYECGFEFNVCG